MGIRTPIAGARRLDGRRIETFDYVSPPRAGFSWAFAQATTMSVILWSSVTLSLTFWACLLVAIARS